MKSLQQWIVTAAFVLAAAGGAQAGEICFTGIDGVQVTTDGSGNIGLNIYSQEVITASGNGSTYMAYSGNSSAVKAIHAQFLYAKATGKKICAVYNVGSPTYRWELTSVAVANANGWPFQ